MKRRTVENGRSGETEMWNEEKEMEEGRKRRDKEEI